MLFVCCCVYFSVFPRLEEGEGFQEDPEDPDYEFEQEEEFAEGKFHYSLVILIQCFINIPVEPVFNTIIACLFQTAD